MRTLETWALGNAWRHRHPGEKVLLGGGMLALAVALPPLPVAPLILAVMVGCTVLGAKVPWRAWLRVSLLPASFLVPAVAAVAVTVTIDGGLRVAFSDEGVRLAAELLLRALAALACLQFLALTTPVLDVLPHLQRLRVPSAVVETTILLYRLLFVLADRAGRLRRAQQARLGYTDRRRSLRSVAALAGAVLVSSLHQARRLETGIATRGAGEGPWRVLTIEPPLVPRRLAATGAALAAVLTVGLVGLQA